MREAINNIIITRNFEENNLKTFHQIVLHRLLHIRHQMMYFFERGLAQQGVFCDNLVNNRHPPPQNNESYKEM